MHSAHGDAAHIAAVVEAGDEHLRVALELRGRRNRGDDGVEQGRDVGGGPAPVGAHPGLLGGAVDRGEVELVFGGVEVEHQVKHHLVDLLGSAVGLVDLVDHHYGLESHLDGLLEHKARLGHRALEGVDEQQAAVGHVEHTLHLAAEVGVSRSVDDVDLRAFVVDRYVLGEYRYATLALEVVVVEDELAGGLVVAEEVAGKEHFVDQCRFPMVHMGYNCYVSNILHLWCISFKPQNYKKSIK